MSSISLNIPLEPQHYLKSILIRLQGAQLSVNLYSHSKKNFRIFKNIDI